MQTSAACNPRWFYTISGCVLDEAHRNLQHNLTSCSCNRTVLMLPRLHVPIVNFGYLLLSCICHYFWVPTGIYPSVLVVLFLGGMCLVVCSTNRFRSTLINWHIIYPAFTFANKLLKRTPAKQSQVPSGLLLPNFHNIVNGISFGFEIGSQTRNLKMSPWTLEGNIWFCSW